MNRAKKIEEAARNVIAALKAAEKAEKYDECIFDHFISSGAIDKLEEALALPEDDTA